MQLIRCKIFLKQVERLKKKESLDMKTIILHTKLMEVFILFFEIDIQSWLEQLSLQWFQFLGYSRLSVRFFDARIGKDREWSWLQCSWSLSMWSTQTVDFKFILYRFARMSKHAWQLSDHQIIDNWLIRRDKGQQLIREIITMGKRSLVLVADHPLMEKSCCFRRRRHCRRPLY